MTLNHLPRIVRITSTFDSGEFGAAHCPHCGADCRYYKEFDAVDSEGQIHHLAAAAGCIKLFPQSKLVEIHTYILDKQRSYEKKGWVLNRADTAILDLIDQAAAGTVAESYALQRIAGIRQSMAAWRKNKKG